MMYHSLVSVPHVVQKWLESELIGLGIDSSVYCPAVLSLLVGDSCHLPDTSLHSIALASDKYGFSSDPTWTRHAIETKRWQVLQCLLTACHGSASPLSAASSSLAALSQLAAELVAVVSALHEPRAPPARDTDHWTGCLLTSADELTGVNSADTRTHAWPDTLPSQRFTDTGTDWAATSQWHFTSQQQRQQQTSDLQPPAPSTNTHFRPISVHPTAAPPSSPCLRPLHWRVGGSVSGAPLCLQPIASPGRLSGARSAFARVRAPAPPTGIDWRPLYLRGRSVEDTAAPVCDSVWDRGDRQPLYARGTAVDRYPCTGPTEYPALRYEMAGGTAADTVVTFCAPLVTHDYPSATNHSNFNDELVSGLMSDCRLVEAPNHCFPGLQGVPGADLSSAERQVEADEDSRLIDLCFAVSLRPCTPFPRTTRLQSQHHSIGLSRCHSDRDGGDWRGCGGAHEQEPLSDSLQVENDILPKYNVGVGHASRQSDRCNDELERYASDDFDERSNGPTTAVCSDDEAEKQQSGRPLAWEFIDERNVINKKGGVNCPRVKSHSTDMDSIARADHLLSLDQSDLFISMCPCDVGCEFDFACQLCHQMSSESPIKELNGDGRYMSANSEDIPWVLGLVDMIEHVGAKRARRSCRRHKSLSDAVASGRGWCSSQGLVGDKRRRRHHSRAEGVRLAPESGARRP